jgi:hypothetical protein
MNKKTFILAAVVVVVVVAGLGAWKAFAPQAIKGDNVSELMSVGYPDFESNGFSVRVTNKTTKKVKGAVEVSISVDQLKVPVRRGIGTIRGLWKPEESRVLFIPYSVKQPFYEANEYELWTTTTVGDL